VHHVQSEIRDFFYIYYRAWDYENKVYFDNPRNLISSIVFFKLILMAPWSSDNGNNLELFLYWRNKNRLYRDIVTVLWGSFLAYSVPCGLEGKNLEFFSNWPIIKGDWAQFSSFGALWAYAHFSVVPSPTPLFFVECLCQMHLFSFPSFREYFRIFLIRLF
jgi:hypothetical protein